MHRVDVGFQVGYLTELPTTVTAHIGVGFTVVHMHVAADLLPVCKHHVAQGTVRAQLV